MIVLIMCYSSAEICDNHLPNYLYSVVLHGVDSVSPSLCSHYMNISSIAIERRNNYIKTVTIYPNAQHAASCG